MPAPTMTTSLEDVILVTGGPWIEHVSKSGTPLTKSRNGLVGIRKREALDTGRNTVQGGEVHGLLRVASALGGRP